ncbi:MAG: DEAD/DEAH box helicase [Xanthobacteraceae bacterium]
MFLDCATWDAALARHDTHYFFAAAPSPTLLVPRFALEPSPVRGFRTFVRTALDDKQRILLTAADHNDLALLTRRAEGCGAKTLIQAESLAQAFTAPPRSIVAMRADLDAGFVLGERRTTVIAAADLLGSRAKHETPIGLRNAGPALDEVALRPGDVVVHRERGVAILRGLETVSAPGVRDRDMVRLEFAGQKTVLVPARELAAIWKYSSDPRNVTLDRADGGTWISRRRELERELEESARRLVALARERQNRGGPVLVPSAGEYERFAARFRYLATSDQAQAIADVLTDLASGQLMDRLVCGDVGFGKTEIALRAAAATALGGKQVAIAVPTTVLALQHVETFRERFAELGIEVGQLSRLAAAAEARAVKKRIADGPLLVVVGTHSLAAKDVRFKELGLLIIDEEQRFGAGHKERLRRLGETVHVLTMTATPIPRTLRLASVGLHKLSVIATPPVRRLAVRTTVAPWDPVVVARALRYERSRGGQSFVVCPRIEDIEQLQRQLREIVPELDIRVLHGRMPVQEIDAVLLAFAAGEGHALLSTNIIESGLDIPRANTMLVWRPDRFGLAQLHQLRGRVGRGTRRAFVYFLLPRGKEEDDTQAMQRLQVLEQNSGLGAGFVISGRDMDLRGAGSLIGEEQSGHVKLVGAEMYRYLVQRAVRRARGDKVVDDEIPEVHIGVSGSIPLDYVGDESIRLELHARIAKASSEKALEDIEDEVEDRFGPLPAALQDRIGLEKIRLKCSRLGISRVDAGPEGIALTTRAARSRLHAQPTKHWRRARDGRLVLRVRVPPDQRLETIARLLDELADQLAQKDLPVRRTGKAP